MFAIRLDYLTGRVVSTQYNDREAVEWPPHPARLFSALTAVWADTDEPDPDERAALEWLESQPAPGIACREHFPRTVKKHYVPVNDTSLWSSSIGTKREKLDTAWGELHSAKAELSAVIGDTKASKQAQRRVDGATRKLEKCSAAYRKAIDDNIQPQMTPAASMKKAAMGLLPDGRIRRERYFPSASLESCAVHFIWTSAPPDDLRACLAELLARLSSLGHSSSLVHARCVDEAPQARWVPASDGDQILRWVRVGQLSQLESDFRRHRGTEPRVLPFFAQPYRHNMDAGTGSRVADSCFESGGWIVLRRVGGDRFPLTRCVDVSTAIRGALMRYCEQQPPPDLISGHGSGGVATSKAHLAVIPLPHIGHRHADGALMGAALIFPRETPEQDRRLVRRAIGRWEQARRDETGMEEDDIPPLSIGFDSVQQELERVEWNQPPIALRASTWCRPSTVWMSATPVALDRNPGNLFDKNPNKAEKAFRAAEKSIAASCVYAGLPVPVSVNVMPSGTWPGGAKARAFPAFPKRSGAGKFRRVKVHARLEFDTPVRGPVLLGAGRFHGLGLFRPVVEGAK